MVEMKEIVGLDIGNGYTKGLIQNVETGEFKKLDFPSCVAIVTNSHGIKSEGETIKDTIVDLYNKADVSFQTNIIKDSSRRLLGIRGIKSGMSLEEFDVHSHLSKVHQDLSSILVLSSVACSALMEYYNIHNELPTETIKYHATLALSLPIKEYKNYKAEYANKFLNNIHYVCFHNFETPIYVEVTFNQVEVTAEGASGQFAIVKNGVNLMDLMLQDARSKDVSNLLSDITSQDVLEAKHTVGVDIGEGTVNFPVFSDGMFSPDSSITFNQGYGTVLSRSLDRLVEKGYPFGSRKALADFLIQTPSKLNKTRHDLVKAVVEEEMVAFAKEVCMQFIKVMSNAGAYTEVVYIYGGGATPMKDILYPLIVETGKSLGQGAEIPILYLDSAYSRYLNRQGLYLIAKHIA